MVQPRFYFDLLSCFGISLITSSFPLFTNFGFFKLVRMLKIRDLIINSTLSEQAKAVANILKLILYLAITLHVIACFFYSCVLANSEVIIDDRPMKWYPPLDYVNYTDSMLFHPDYTLMERYCVVLYSAVMIFAGEELGPVNNIEYLFISVGKILCVILNVMIFGDIANMVAILQKEDAKF